MCHFIPSSTRSRVAKVDPRPSMREVIRKSIPFEYGNGSKSQR